MKKITLSVFLLLAFFGGGYIVNAENNDGRKIAPWKVEAREDRKELWKENKGEREAWREETKEKREEWKTEMEKNREEWKKKMEESARERDEENIEEVRKEVDDLLDKINKVGMDGLTRTEQQRLEKASKFLRDRGVKP